MSSPTEPLLTFPEIRVVEASAGSGKTYALAKRYVQLLLSRDSIVGKISIQQILAITFTNKASYEMKSRILDFLKKIALKSLSPYEVRDILTPLGLSTEEAAGRAYLLMDELIRHYNFFQVQTIDSFMNALLIGCAFKLKLSANFRIRQNAVEYLQYSLDELIERAGRQERTAKIFAEFLQQYLFLENKTSWFPKDDILNLLTALYQQNNIYGFDFVPYPLEEDLFTQKRKIMALMRDLHEKLPAETDGRFRKSLDDFLARYQDAFDFDRLSNYFAREELPLRKDAPPAPAAENLWAQIRRRLQNLSEAEATSLFNPYIEVFNEVRELFQELSQRDDVLFLEELNRKARSLFDDGAITVDELYYRLATRLHHYLLDEFQDTSRMQWRNLFPMVEEAIASGGSLFYVGDKKQAIYSFRGGEPKLFDEVKTQLSAFPITLERLGRNYRSQKAVVEFNNRIFSPENLRRFIAAKEGEEAKKNKDEVVFFNGEDFATLENIFASSEQAWREDRDGGYVKVAYVDGQNKEERDTLVRAEVLKLCADLHSRYAYEQLAILARDNSEVETITTWLLEAGIPAESERTLNIKENPLIQEILAFLKFLESPIDNRAFVDFLTGEIFSRVTSKPKAEQHDFVFSLRPQIRQKHDVYVYKEFRDRFPEIWERYIDEFFRNVGLYPLYELVVSLLEKFQVLENFPEQQGFVMRFLELIKEQEEEASDITSFLGKFDSLRDEEQFVRPTQSRAVKILTIHKSKGLEFPVVIIPFLGMDLRVGEGGRLGQQSYLLNFQGDHQELLRIKRKYSPYSEKLTAIYHQDYIRNFLSEVNNIYVAFTRPADELYVLIPKKNGNSFNVVNFLIPPEMVEVGTPQAPSPKKEKVLSVPVLLPVSRYHDWIEYLGEEFGDDRRVFNRAAALRGDILHFILAQIRNLSTGDTAGFVKEALQAAQSAYPQEKDWKIYENKALAILSAAALKQFFAVPGAAIQTEVEIVTRAGQLRRIDRLIVADDEIWVVDYKTSREKREKDRLQVQDYLTIMAEIYPGKKLAGYLLYTDELELEKI